MSALILLDLQNCFVLSATLSFEWWWAEGDGMCKRDNGFGPLEEKMRARDLHSPFCVSLQCLLCGGIVFWRCRVNLHIWRKWYGCRRCQGHLSLCIVTMFHCKASPVALEAHLEHCYYLAAWNLYDTYWYAKRQELSFRSMELCMCVCVIIMLLTVAIISTCGAIDGGS